MAMALRATNKSLGRLIAEAFIIPVIGLYFHLTGPMNKLDTPSTFCGGYFLTVDLSMEYFSPLSSIYASTKSP